VLAYLKGSRDLIHQRMAARHEHFMPIALLDSQFTTLEEPTPDEHPIVEATQSFTAAFLVAGVVLVIGIVAYVFILGRLELIADPPAV
jgi:gluconate kinase